MPFHKLKLTSLVSTIAMQAVFVPVAFAQATASAPQGAEASDIVVTAQRRSETLARTPVAVTALTPEAMAQKVVVSETDLQRVVPGLTVKATVDSNQLNFSIRGQTLEQFTGSQPAVQPYFNEIPLSGDSPTTLYDLDSIQVLKGPQGTLFGRNVTGGAVLFTSAKPKDAFGGYVQGVVGNYGAHGIQGAINVPLIEDRLLVRIAGDLQRRKGFARNLADGKRLGTLHRDSLRGSVTFRLSEDLENTLVVDYNRTGGNAMPGVAYSAYPPGATNNGIPLATLTGLLFSPALDQVVGVPGAWQAYLAAHPGADPDGLLAFVAKQKARGPYVVDLPDRADHRATNVLVSNVTTWSNGDGLQIKNIFGFNDYKSLDHRDQDGVPFMLERTEFRQKNRAYSDELQVLADVLDDRLSITAGAYYLNLRKQVHAGLEFFDLSPIIPLASLTNIFELKTEDFAGYAHVTGHLDGVVQGLSLTAGVRYTTERVTLNQLPGSALANLPGLSNSVSKRFNQVNWQFGINEQVNPDFLLYAVTRRSFRSGGFNGYQASIPGDASVGGNQFAPEIATDVELGAKFYGRLGGMPARLNIALYQQWIKDIQRVVYATTAAGGLNALTVNVPKARVRGVEFDGQIDLANWLQVGGSVAYTDARFTDNIVTVFNQISVFSPYPDTPKWAGTAFALVRHQLPNDLATLSLRGDVYFQSHSFFSPYEDTTNPGTRLEKYSIVNFRLMADRIGGSGLSLALQLSNAFNKVYYAGGTGAASVLGTNYVVAGEPRTFRAEARFAF